MRSGGGFHYQWAMNDTAHIFLLHFEYKQRNQTQSMTKLLHRNPVSILCSPDHHMVQGLPSGASNPLLRPASTVPSPEYKAQIRAGMCTDICCRDNMSLLFPRRRVPRHNTIHRETRDSFHSTPPNPSPRMDLCRCRHLPSPREGLTSK